MIAVVCVDDKDGMLFNRRRQSQDSLLRQDMLEEAGGRPVWMNAYSHKQFVPAPDNIRIAADFPARAGKGEFCFFEDVDPASWLDRAEQLIVYRWNRRYPADRFFTMPQKGWTLERREDFAGSSHEWITKEVWT